ncbi:MAG: DUF6531 domain-containing protein [Syntrophothermus sp.]
MAALNFSFPAAAATQEVTINYEAEDAVLATPIVVGEDKTASGEKFAHVPSDGSIPTTDPGYLLSVISAPVQGQYTMWVRLYAPAADSNAFHIAITRPDPADATGNSQIVIGEADVSTTTTGVWEWIQIPSAFTLDAGVISITIGRLNDTRTGTRLDQIWLTNSQALPPGYTPPASSGTTTTQPLSAQSTSSGTMDDYDLTATKGLKPFGQYFKNRQEYVSPASGSLIMRQTDLVLPGRGMDLAITRVYNSTILYKADKRPAFPTNPRSVFDSIWDLDIPWVGTSSDDNYLHLENGEQYKIEFKGISREKQRFENYKGEHLVLEALGYTTDFLWWHTFHPTSYVLYRANGTRYYFNADGTIDYILDHTGQNKIDYQ